MGKRIPKSKKHKKLKFVDPCYSGPGPIGKIRRKLPNEPPTKEDHDFDGPPSRSLQNIIDMKNRGKQKRKKKKKAIKDDFIVVKNTIFDTHQINEKRGLPSTVKQQANETEEKFFGRLQRMTDIARTEAKMEEKYNIQVVSIDKDGNAEYVKDSKEISEKKKERRRLHKVKLKEKKRQKIEDKKFDLRREKVRFGDVVSAPPVISSKLKRAPEFVKAGKRQLALKQLLPSSKDASEEKVTPLSTKWKTLPPVKRKEVENERLRAVQMYRLMKNKK